MGSSVGIAITADNLVVGAGASAIAKEKDDYRIYDTTGLSALLRCGRFGHWRGGGVREGRIEWHRCPCVWGLLGG